MISKECVDDAHDGITVQVAAYPPTLLFRQTFAVASGLESERPERSPAFKIIYFVWLRVVIGVSVRDVYVLL